MVENTAKQINTDLFYESGNTYAVTLNPQDKYQYFGNPDRLQKLHNKLYELFLNRPKGMDYKFFFEISEPKLLKCEKGGPRIHIHGWITFNTDKSVYKFLLTFLYKLQHIGILDIDTIDNMDTWQSYCTKQQRYINVKPLSNVCELEKEKYEQLKNDTTLKLKF